jgi:hypothetical protein
MYVEIIKLQNLNYKMAKNVKYSVVTIACIKSV